VLFLVLRISGSEELAKDVEHRCGLVRLERAETLRQARLVRRV